MIQLVKLKLNILQRLLNSAQVSMKPILNVSLDSTTRIIIL